MVQVTASSYEGRAMSEGLWKTGFSHSSAAWSPGLFQRPSHPNIDHCRYANALHTGERGRIHTIHRDEPLDTEQLVIPADLQLPDRLHLLYLIGIADDLRGPDISFIPMLTIGTTFVA